jgi:hypothetical protein
MAFMASVYRITAVWQGFTGAPGYSKFSWADLTDATSRNAAGAKVKQLFEDLKAYRLAAMTVLVLPTIDEFDMATGALIGSQSMTTPPTVSVGTAASTAYAGGSGFCITWNTGLVLDRRRVRGRTFFVPAVAAYDTDGSLAAGVLTAVNTAANTFLALTAPRPNIWSRQWNNAQPPVQVGGALAPVDSFTFKDQASQLRSRRL